MTKPLSSANNPHPLDTAPSPHSSASTYWLISDTSIPLRLTSTQSYRSFSLIKKEASPWPLEELTAKMSQSSSPPNTQPLPITAAKTIRKTQLLIPWLPKSNCLNSTVISTFPGPENVPFYQKRQLLKNQQRERILLHFQVQVQYII
jgi:hypothetical protein